MCFYICTIGEKVIKEVFAEKTFDDVQRRISLTDGKDKSTWVKIPGDFPTDRSRENLIYLYAKYAIGVYKNKIRLSGNGETIIFEDFFRKDKQIYYLFKVITSNACWQKELLQNLAQNKDRFVCEMYAGASIDDAKFAAFIKQCNDIVDNISKAKINFLHVNNVPFDMDRLFGV